MTGRLDGDVALVTGAARGIGAAIARRFAGEGARLVLADVLDDDAAALAAELGPAAVHRHLDVADPLQWASAVSGAEGAFGRLSVLVNNAGIHATGSIEEEAPERFRHVLEVNLYGPWLGMRAAAPALRRARGGVVINLSSTAGLVGVADLGAYAASKWGLRGLTKVAALELARGGTRVCSIHPGAIRTPMTAGMADGLAAGQPIPRFGTPEEVAAMALFLAAEATFSTGSEFVLDGGATTGSLPPEDHPGHASREAE